MATVFAVPTTANAAAVHPDPVTSASAAGGVNKVTVSWNSPTTGEAPTSYVVVLFNESGVQIGDPHVVLVPATSLVIEDVPAGKYFAEVFTHNAYPGFGGPVGTNTVTVTAPADPGTPAPPAINTNPFRPYANWDDLIDQEYRFWTGCEASADELAGRFPRDDEYTFWRDKLTNSFWSTQDWDRYNDALVERSAAEWARLTNGATWTAGVNITSPGYETSIAYKALFDAEYKRLTTIPAAGGSMPADNGWDDPGTLPADAGIANNNLLEPDELLWARYHADLYATWPANLEAAYSAQVAALANQRATDDVYFGRRVDFVRNLAEDAAQTGGPAYRLYTAYFSRIPDAKGLCFWSNALRTDWSLLNVSEFFVQSDEFIATYGEYDPNGGEDSIDAAEFVSLVYRNVLDRDPDGAGAAFWTRQLQSERASAAEMLIGFSESPEFKNFMATKVGAGLAYLHLLGRMPTPVEYVHADFYSLQFQTTPETDWYATAFVWNSSLYEYLVDSPSGEYTARAGIEIPSHHHPHSAPGTQPL
ncbi:MAG: DUF4214 domain-containing protein [Acidimicrobiales bacterium]|nr:DUF4214 domain-containing protein [Acidimicrobiales bacterium]